MTLNSELKKFRGLPPKTKSALSSPGSLAVIGKIEKKYKIKIGRLIIKVAIAELSPKNFQKQLEKRFSLATQEVKSIASELNSKIFSLLPALPSSPAKKTVADPDQIAPEIMRQSGLKFSEAFVEQRFKNLILSFLREFRTLVQVQDFLERPIKIGGLALDKNQSQKIIKILRTEKKKLDDARDVKGKKPQSKIDQLIFSEAAPFVGLKKSAPKDASLKTPKKKTSKKNLAPPASLPVAKKTKTEPQDKELHISTPKPPIPPIPIPKPKPPTSSPTFGEIEKKLAPSLVDIKKPKPFTPSPTPPPSPSPKRPKVLGPQLESIKEPPSRVVGGVEEVGALRLADFRKWSPEPDEAAARVKEKIDSLEDESLAKKAQAIYAWQNSEINKLYLDIGRESMDTGESVETVIKRRQHANQPALNLDEFNAIADLNKSLSF